MTVHSVDYTTNDYQFKENEPWRENLEGETKNWIENKSQIQNKNGGENRTRTCKRLRAVVFKTTALPLGYLSAPSRRIQNIPQSPSINNYFERKKTPVGS